MHRITQIFVPLFLLAAVLGACAKTKANPQTTPATTTAATTTTLAQTGYPSGEVQRPQVVYGGFVYLYVAEGINNPLPSGFAAVGAVETVDNRALSEKPDWCGSRVEVGQRIFANADQPNTLYLEYAEGYGKFVCTELQSIHEHTDCADPEVTAGIGYNALTVRIPFLSNSGLLPAPVAVIDSPEDLAEYAAMLATVLDTEVADLQAAIANYSENSAFFENDYLLIAHLTEGSGSIRHEPMDIRLMLDGTAELWVRRLHPEVGTCDMASWLMFAEVYREDLPSEAISSVTLAFEDGKLDGVTECQG